MANDNRYPEVGSRWFNNRRQTIYTVIGVVSSCDSDDWEVLYRSDDMPVGQHRRRSLEDWFGINRYGLPRFVLVEEQVQESG
jgi:hypothetical protein